MRFHRVILRNRPKLSIAIAVFVTYVVKLYSFFNLSNRKFFIFSNKHNNNKKITENGLDYNCDLLDFCTYSSTSKNGAVCCTQDLCNSQVLTSPIKEFKIEQFLDDTQNIVSSFTANLIFHFFNLIILAVILILLVRYIKKRSVKQS